MADSALPRDTVGDRVRQARQRRRWSQSDLGSEIGFSASVISRIETGQRRTDLSTLLAIADATGTAPEVFGVLRPDAPRDTALPHPPPGPRSVATLIHEPTKGAVVQRREFFLSAIALAGATSGNAPAETAPAGSPRAVSTERAVADLDQVLFHPAEGRIEPAGLAELDRALIPAQSDFRRANYGALGAKLPGLIALAQTTRDATDAAARGHTERRLADALSLASDWCSKQNQDALAWVTADRALSAAQRSGHVAAIGEAARTMAIAMRRSGHHVPATDLLQKTATDLYLDYGDPPAAHLAVYGTLLLTAAYSAAQHGNRVRAGELLAEAETTATRIAQQPAQATGLFSGSFGPDQVGLYGVSVHHALGEHAQALRCARTVRLEQLPTAERRARFYVDVSRTQHAAGNPVGAYHALLAAEHFAPEDVRRPSVRALTAELLYTPRSSGTMPGLRGFAERTGARL